MAILNGLAIGFAAFSSGIVFVTGRHEFLHVVNAVVIVVNLITLQGK